jgi:hypothetical protein
LAKSLTNPLAIIEGRALTKSGDEIWILFGCATPMVLWRTVLYFLVVSPAYISGIMDGEAMGKVTTPDDRSGGWSEMLRTGKLSPAPVF